MTIVRNVLNKVTTTDAERDADNSVEQVTERSIKFVYIPKRVQPVSVTFILCDGADERDE
jgi:hypothetical protein